MIFLPLFNPNPTSNRQGTYSSNVCFLQMGKTQRMDNACDVYIMDSLKLSTMADRGTGTLKCVSSYVKLPGN